MNNSIKLILLYAGSNGFPLGDAYTNRVLSLAKGLIISGCQLELFIVYPGKKSGLKKNTGIYESVPYKYCTFNRSSKFALLKNIIGFTGILNTSLKFLFKYKKTDAVISFSENVTINSVIGKICHFNKTLFIREVNEFPLAVLKRGNFLISENEKRKIINNLKNFDGLLCISNGISNYFSKELLYQKPILVVPITVDKSRFDLTNDTKPENRITYCGNIFGEKDGIEILLKAFAKIALKNPKYYLYLIGDTGNKIEFDKLKTMIANLSLSSRVVFKGFVNRNEIPELLHKSIVLVLARPDNMQAKGGFPTKLGEYLATGRPVVATSVGDIPIYLKDGVNCYLAEPGNIESLSQKLYEALTNTELSANIGLQGKKLVDEVFDGNIQAKRIIEFIHSI